MLLDRECRIVRANRATAELVGMENSQLIGKHCFTVMHGSACPPPECPFRCMLLSGREEESEITEPRLAKILRGSAIPLRDGAGNPQGAILVVRDITERKHLEQELLQAQKLEAIGRLPGEIAHDFNNILSVIVGYSELMQERIPEANSTLRKQVSEIRKAADRAAGVTRQLLAFSRKQVMQLRPVRLNDILTDLGTMLRTLIGENIELTIRTAGDLGIVKVDPIQIQQVLINLAINARDAMPKGGELSIISSNAEVDAHFPRSHDPVVPGSYVMIAVSDTGLGMDKETLSHIFEPFFTTKEEAKGTGFGLSMVYGIVKQSGGYVRVQSQPGHGSTFTIYLPSAAEKPSNVVPIAPSVSGKQSATILLVEDEQELARVVRSVLEDSGYVVLHAPSGEEALDIARSYEHRIDLLLSDIILRGTMDGLELARRLSTVRPETRSLFMSGYSDALNGAASNINVTLLEKPFTNTELRQKVREALEGVAATYDQFPPGFPRSKLHP